MEVYALLRTMQIFLYQGYSASMEVYALLRTMQIFLRLSVENFRYVV
jgi:hypothetical protein